MENNVAPHTPVRTYLWVFASLAALTGLTVILSYLSLSHGKAVVLASLIAIAKCTLIAAFFMHLRSEKKSIHAIFFTALFFVAVLLLAILPDIGIIQ